MTDSAVNIGLIQYSGLFNFDLQKVARVWIGVGGRTATRLE